MTDPTHGTPRLLQVATVFGLVLIASLGFVGCGRLHYDSLASTFDGGGAIDSGITVADASATGGGDVPIPLARYRVREARSGQAPTQLRDNGPFAFHLPLTYVGGSPFFDEDASEQRFLRFVGTPATDTGGARRDTTGTPLASLNGSRTATLEAKYTVDTCSNADYRIVGVSNGDDPPTAGWLLIRENNGVEFLAVRWSSSTAAATYRMPIDCPFAEPRTPAVVHWVIDTEAPIEADRVRAYVDGERQSVTPFSGVAGLLPFPPRNATIDLIADETTPPTLVLGTEATGFRTANQRIWYAAIYDAALTDAQAAAQASALAVADD